MTDQNDHLSRDITAEEAPAVIAQYQQWLADRDLNIAGLSVKLAKANGRLQFAVEDLQKMEQERDAIQTELDNTKRVLENVQQSKGVVVLTAPEEETE